MRILGIDPGYAIVGWGVLDYERNQFSIVDFGAITTDAKTPFPERLKIIYEDIMYILNATQPDAVSMEKLFFQNNQKTAIDVAQARGVLMLAAEQKGIDVFEYTPLQVKQGVVGYGKAEKKQVQEMTRTILKLDKVPKPDDTADALAMAICHAHCNGSSLGSYGSFSASGNTRRGYAMPREVSSENLSQKVGREPLSKSDLPCGKEDAFDTPLDKAITNIVKSGAIDDLANGICDGISEGIKYGKKILKEHKGI